MDPNTAFTKIWRLRNEGITWPENTSLIFVGGDQMSTVDTIPVATLANGQEVDIAVDMTAPSKPGRYVGYWRLAHPDGSRFGQRVWVDICVSQPSTPSTELPTLVDFSSPNPAPSVEDMETTSNTDPMAEEFVIVHNPLEVPSVESKPAVLPVVEPVVPMVVPSPMVPVVPLVEPVVPTMVPVVPMSPELAQLIEMGFTSDVEFLSAVLNANGNDVLKTVQQLLQMK